MMKKLNFPMVEKEVQPASVVPKVSVAIQKRVAKLAEHKMTLEAVAAPNEMHKKFLDCALCPRQLCFLYTLIWSDRWPLWMRLLEKIRSLYDGLQSADATLNESYTTGVVDGFTKEHPGMQANDYSSYPYRFFLLSAVLGPRSQKKIRSQVDSAKKLPWPEHFVLPGYSTHPLPLFHLRALEALCMDRRVKFQP